MTKKARTFRVFVSSTFSDLKAERNALQEQVFPKLREKAAEHGYRFQAIDLRWGVSDQASLDQQAMNICLSEVERCQQTSPRPNFIVLLGDRYGWCPPPAQIPADDFDKIKISIKDNEEQVLLKEWYRLDKNAVPHEYKLKARTRSDFEKYEDWEPIEIRLQEILAGAAKKLKFDDKKLLPYTTSATEQEIEAGALNITNAKEHVFCFFREIKDLPKKFNAVDFQKHIKENLEVIYKKTLAQPSFDALLKKIYQFSPKLNAKDFDEELEILVEKSPEDSADIEFLSMLRTWLAAYIGKDFQNLTSEDWTQDKESFENQINLKGRLKGHVEGNDFNYTVQWTGRGITIKHIDQLCKNVYDSLERIILEEIENPTVPESIKKIEYKIKPDLLLDNEGLAHHQFAEERLRIFVGRTEILEKIANYLNNPQGRALAIVGVGGTGKSALTAKAIQETQEAYTNTEIVYRFIGATPGSSEGRSLLDSLCHEISRRYEVSETDIPMDYRDLVPELGKRMQLASEDRPLILFLDSLDQLSPSQGARSLVWLPNELPEHVSVIATTRDEDTFENLLAKQAREEILEGLSLEDGNDLLSKWLEKAHRKLQPLQTKELLDKFEQGEKVLKKFEEEEGKKALDEFRQSPGNPLYLKLAFEEARQWTSFSGDSPEDLALGVSGIIKKNMFDRLEDQGNHGKELVSHALGYLAASRDGLTEDELIELLSRDYDVYKWFFDKTWHLPADLIRMAEENRPKGKKKSSNGNGKPAIKNSSTSQSWLKDKKTPKEDVEKFLRDVLKMDNGPRLPVVLWSRLSFDLAPYLTERMVDGSPLLSFYHRELGDISKENYLGGEKGLPFQEKLADYFQFKADPKGDGSWTGSYPHGLSELPYHLTKALRWDQVYETLTDFNFLEHKADEVGVLVRIDDRGDLVKTYSGVLQLQDDFERVLEEMPGDGESGNGGRPPLIVTAVDAGDGLSVYCPVCNTTSPLNKDLLDKKITCPVEGCNTPLKINPFVIKRS